MTNSFVRDKWALTDENPKLLTFRAELRLCVLRETFLSASSTVFRQ